MQCSKIIISGHVQGVFFRQTAKEVADRMKLSGTVKNLPTGDVEIIVHCDGNEAKTLLEKIGKTLSAGEIRSYTVSTIDIDKKIEGFNIL